jgi:thiamine pyrophosphokinase
MKVLFIANGTCEETLPDPTHFDCIVAVDGGGNYADHAGILPHQVIGDGDSLSPVIQQRWRAQGVPFLLFSTEKDLTDLEIALLWAKDHGMTEGVVYGGLGGRIDQSIANICLLTDDRFAACPLTFIYHDTRLSCVRSEIIIHNAIGDTLSLLYIERPIPRLTVRGCQYTLENAPLLRVTHGMSNVITHATAHIVVHTGKLLVVHTSRMHVV